MIINNKVYRHYPKIREEDIGKDTSNLFVDTMNFANNYLKAIGGDYDGENVMILKHSISSNWCVSTALNALKGSRARFTTT